QLLERLGSNQWTVFTADGSLSAHFEHTIAITEAEPRGYSVVREYTGHGIGREMHEEPQIPNFG
ncbi:unnamed protein product, partial [marine sediment metagenome]